MSYLVWISLSLVSLVTGGLILAAAALQEPECGGARVSSKRDRFARETLTRKRSCFRRRRRYQQTRMVFEP